jgi:hypothetical protein
LRNEAARKDHAHGQKERRHVLPEIMEMFHPDIRERVIHIDGRMIFQEQDHVNGGNKKSAENTKPGCGAAFRLQPFTL